jgi:nucleoside-diphosphate-sugar epimerase
VVESSVRVDVVVGAGFAGSYMVHRLVASDLVTAHDYDGFDFNTTPATGSVTNGK